jgi:hypothetical protein
VSSTYVSAALRRLVIARARSACEYCLIHDDDTFHGCQVDHVVSEKHGGPTEESNLALACSVCNRRAPEHSVALAIIAGAPLALGVHTAKASARVGSTAFTGGLANPLISIIEDVVAVVLIILGLIAPILALLLAVALLWKLVSYARKMARRRRAAAVP